MAILDNVPVATLLVLAAVVGGLIALVDDTVTYQEFLQGLGIFAGGTGILGYARAKSGKGVVR